MRTVRLAGPDDFEGWRRGARSALAAGVSPDRLVFEIDGECGDLFADPCCESAQDGRAGDSAPGVQSPRVPKPFIELARQVACHSDRQRFALLYRLLARLQDDRDLLQKTTDTDVHAARERSKSVRRDAHKMKAFVRFRKTGEASDGTEHFVAWFEPAHHIVRLTAPFFTRRFANMHWSVLTPGCCAHWDGSALRFSPGVAKSNAPAHDALEDWWKSYYASIFNPARLKLAAMQSEMPRKYWHNLPEASLIPDLVKTARDRERQMVETAPTRPRAGMMAHRQIASREVLPTMQEADTLDALQAGLKGCRACPLWQPATQAVPGRGPSGAAIMLVGEQPGDMEDLAGEPFVGPAGQLLRDLMADVGMQPDAVYLTNAVKHFKFRPRGKRRLHQNPSAGEIDHCRWWLMREIELVGPRIIVALGGSAVRSLTGRTQSVSSLRNRVLSLEQSTLVVTRHPASILRLRDGDARHTARSQLKADLSHALELSAA